MKIFYYTTNICSQIFMKRQNMVLKKICNDCIRYGFVLQKPNIWHVTISYQNVYQCLTVETINMIVFLKQYFTVIAIVLLM